MNEQSCNARGCCWNTTLGAADVDTTTTPTNGIPICFYPSQFGYKLDSVARQSDDVVQGALSLFTPYEGPYGSNINNLNMTITAVTNAIVRVKFVDSAKARYEVPVAVPQVTQPRGNPDDDLYAVSYVQAPAPFGLTVTRKASATAVVDTRNIGGLVYEDQFLQLTTRTPSTTAYGLGEHVAPLLLDFDWTTLSLFARDQGTPTGYSNLYGVHPLIVFIEADGAVSGVFLYNSNAMDVALQPTPAMTFRTIGGVLDFFILLGPTIDALMEQYTAIVGRPTMPPYWALGFHLCRWGYNSVNRTAQIVNAMRRAGIPQDTQWNDIDYMNNHLDFTYDPVAFKGLPDFVDDLHAHHQHYVMIVDPGISNAQPKGTYPPYDQGLAQNVFILNASGQPLIGSVWPGTTAFPDFLNPATVAYWSEQVAQFHKTVQFDGLWIDMNEIANFVQGSTVGCPSSPLESPPYMPHIADNMLRAKTICMTARHYHNQLEYNVHSMYGFTETIATRTALETTLQKRTLVISRSSFSGSGSHGGHWLGDNDSTWAAMAASIAGIINFNLFGIPMVGADICGFNGNTNAELCARWMQLGAFYPFSRNHNTIGATDQDPTSLGQQVLEISREVLLLRYSLLPLLYSLFHRAHTTGAPVARSLSSDFPSDPTTHSLDQQFTWGGVLLITPVLHSGDTTVRGYFPQGQWYSIHTGEPVDSSPSQSGRFVILPAPLTVINIHVRGGSIIPTQVPATTTHVARQNPMGLIVALQDGAANGFQFSDDGESLDSLTQGRYSFVWYNATTAANGVGTLKSTVLKSGYINDPPITTLTLFGLSSCPSSVTVNAAHADFTCDSVTRTVAVSNIKVYLTEQFTAQWS